MKFSKSITLFTSFLGLSLFALMQSSCSSGSGGGAVADTGYGPFDSRGNYVEAWADNPEKWNRRSTTTPDIEPEPEPTLLASNDTPPATLSPISTSSSSGPVEVARLKSTTTTISNTTKTRSTSISTNPSASTSSRPKTTSTAKKTTTKPKTVASKSRSSSSARVVVKKGDTLSGLASRHRSSVSAIQKANSMRDTKLVIGRSLVIPRM